MGVLCSNGSLLGRELELRTDHVHMKEPPHTPPRWGSRGFWIGDTHEPEGQHPNPVLGDSLFPTLAPLCLTVL
jgi:hypothetical protein